MNNSSLTSDGMIRGVGLIKEFGPKKDRVLHSMDLTIKPSEFISISGKSGSGKSTLLYILSTLDNPTYGKVFINGQDIQAMSTNALHQLRNLSIGFIFQFHYLLPELTILENILLPARNANQYKVRYKRALSLLEQLDIQSKQHQFPSELSGGQQQRVAIARSLIMQPRYLFADEPTGNLDTQNATIVMEMLKLTNEQDKTTVVLVTHDPDFSKMAKRELHLVDGKIADIH